jgi:hypothetical protein
MQARQSANSGWPTLRCEPLAAAEHNHNLTSADYNAAEQMWDEYWAATRSVEFHRDR